MAVTDVNGTQSATLTTEHTLANTSAAATYCLNVRVSNMAAGDVTRLRIYKKVLTGDTAGGATLIAWEVTLQGLQPLNAPVVFFPPISTALTDSGAIRATLLQSLGTGRNYDWCLERFV